MATRYANRRAGDAAARQDTSRNGPAIHNLNRLCPQWLSVFAGEKCIGHVLNRGRSGFEAFNRDDDPIGHYPSVHEAAAAIIGGAS